MDHDISDEEYQAMLEERFEIEWAAATPEERARVQKRLEQRQRIEMVSGTDAYRARQARMGERR